MGVALALAVPREHTIAHEALEHAGGGWPGYPGPFCQSPGGHLALRSYKLDGDLRVPRHLGRFRGEDAPARAHDAVLGRGEVYERTT